MPETIGPTTPESLVEAVYATFPRRIAIARERLGRPMTFAEKVLAAHADDPWGAGSARGVDYADYRPDRVAMQDATAQMALLQFMLAEMPSVAVPTTVHCDHLIQARVGADADMQVALDTNREVYEFLRTVSSKYGIGFWKPGSGIIHQVVLENYAFPGGMMIGTDSHTPNAGGLAMLAIGVGGADAVDVMAGWPYNTRVPKLIGVRLTGTLSGWSAAKDIILKVAGILTVTGGTDAIVQYFGPGAQSISATGRATVCNMGAEIGATCSLFAYDHNTAKYLKATGREAIADLADRHAEHLVDDAEVEADPERFFDRIIEIDLSALEPHLVGPHTPDLARPVSEVAAAAVREGYPTELSAALVGSCTNSSYEDIGRAAHLARQAAARGLRVKTPLMITPGSEQVRATIERDGLLADLEAIGATVLANACGPCIGQWRRDDAPGGPNVIVTSFNRNFPARNDGNKNTLAFIGSPETVVGMALSGRLDGSFLLEFDPPVADDLPARGFDRGASGFAAPAHDPERVTVAVAPESDRLELLEPFPAWDGHDIRGLRVLLKAKGKCTTDHVSPAGKWLTYRGHLAHISRNLFLGAVNAFADAGPGLGVDARDGSIKPLPELALEYKIARIEWIAVGDENYGEGSSREHAAMEPRYMGGRAVLARSFARIAEANLKKQGVLPLTFADPADYDKVRVDDLVDLVDLGGLSAPGSSVHVALRHADGTAEVIAASHTLSDEHIEWFNAGSALNLLASRRRS
ncbi:MAG: aconitate hydratase [Actinomycetota bacterium]|jgi:aconitate hydratase|nr:aconitate hydratase [Actinomycetota bacterium]